jgi:hypothetical protein
MRCLMLRSYVIFNGETCRDSRFLPDLSSRPEIGASDSGNADKVHLEWIHAER